jgi:hypothetical protein
MALSEKQKTAYHEGGHCYRAWRYHFLAVQDTCIFEEPPGEWWGRTPIRRPSFTDAQRTEIALAGLLAEAKAVATDEGEIRLLAIIPGMALSIVQLFETQDIPVAGPGVEFEDDAWPIEVAIQGADTVTAYVTKTDLAEIPLACRNVESVGAALAALVPFLNTPMNWAAVAAIGRSLLILGNGCIDNFLVYGIITAATRPYLEDI